MNKSNQNPFLYFILFIVFVPLLILSIGLGFNMIEDTDFKTAPFVADEVNQTFEGDSWLQGDLSANMLYNDQQGYIYPDQNSQGTWTSPIADIPRNRIVILNYDADLADGSGTITVNAWIDEPNDTTISNPNASKSFDLETGMVEEEVNFAEYNYFQTEISMTEEANDGDKFPRMNKLNVLYEIVEGRQFGMDSSEVIILFVLLMFFAIAFFVIGISAKIKEGMENI